MKDEIGKLLVSSATGSASASCGLAFVLTLVATGCNSASDASIERPGRVELSTEETVDVEWQGDRAVAVRTASGESVPFRGGEAEVGDQLVVQSGDGRVEVFRKPNAVTAEINQLPYLYLHEETLEELVVDGFQGEPTVGPNRSLYWTARTCENPSCGSQSMGSGERPYLFISRLQGVSVSDAGTVTTTEAGPGSYLIPCPVCKKFEHVTQYELPNTASRKSELTDELTRIRAARDAASR